MQYNVLIMRLYTYIVSLMFCCKHDIPRAPGAHLFNHMMRSDPNNCSSCCATCAWEHTWFWNQIPITPWLLANARAGPGSWAQAPSVLATWKLDAKTCTQDWESPTRESWGQFKTQVVQVPRPAIRWLLVLVSRWTWVSNWTQCCLVRIKNQLIIKTLHLEALNNFPGTRDQRLPKE